MTEADVIRIMREHLERLFPKICPNCRRDEICKRILADPARREG
jgi:hypothetical protein